MSFDKLNKQELLRAAEFFGSEVKETDSKADIRAVLTEDGVTFADYQKHLAPDEPKAPVEQTEGEQAVAEEAAEPEPEAEKVLVRMTRANPTYEAYGYRFTKTHPFALVSEDVVDRLLTRHEGFRTATPKEAAEFYR